ncbi:transglycosylase domain-containing protein [Aquiflexum sp.]|uniref:transglycosylase domain-containing protein n=1 Tax=Aquiflexum sp. TaxID=1872584 RepID=UPI0035930DF3
MLTGFERLQKSFGERVTAHWKLILSRPKYQLWVFIAIVLLLITMLALFEVHTSRMQAWYFSSVSRDLIFHTEAGPAATPLSPTRGPYDLRLGYAQLPQFITTLSGRGYHVNAQARVSDRMHKLTKSGIHPIYHQKNQAGLTLLADDGEQIYMNRFPHRVYESYNDIPPVLVQTLLFIENRTLLNPSNPYMNPAIDWNRLGKAAMEKALSKIGSPRRVPGGSTLATQLEKVRHSPEGITENVAQKIRQMLSASFRSYLGGEQTLESRKSIVLNYFNALPLAAIPGFGEVIGLGDGMWAWYSIGFEDYNSLLFAHADDLTEEEQEVRSEIFRRVLSLFLAQRRPSYYLTTPEGLLQLNRLTDIYSKMLLREGVISPDLHHPEYQVSTDLRRVAPKQAVISFIDRKDANAVRTELLDMLQVNSLYDLDRFDLTVQTTFNKEVQQAVTQVLQQLHDPEFIRKTGFEGWRLISGDPEKINYAVVLYERTSRGNLLRVQTDNVDNPLNINSGTKLELGSTAKLRVLINYLEIISDLYETYAGVTPVELRQIQVPGRNAINRWALDYLANHSDATRRQLLEAALQRKYSASTAERFFTGGGVHTFSNFDGKHEGRMMTVAEAFNHSVNLPFIRLMRDIVNYYAGSLPGNPTSVLDDPHHPGRMEYLSRFADMEGRQFMDQFYRKYRDKNGDELISEALKDRQTNPRRAAWIFRSIRPEASMEQFLAIRDIHPKPAVLDEIVAFNRAGIEPLNWQDRGYLASVHPLELWLVSYLYHNPRASRTDWIEASADVRKEVYGWLFKLNRKRAQDNRIWQVIEKDAFAEMHRAWQRVGYPFPSLVPSYATAIGSSADRPSALAELVGIILNDGIRMPMARMENLHFAFGTPYETVMEREPARGVRVLSSEVAAVVHDAMVNVVEQGTGRRVAGTMKTSEGEVLTVGAKTGTGNNRIQVFGPRGTLLESRALNRTSTLVFFIGDHFFGTITVYVSGREASGHAFTSSLPAQLLRYLAPELQPLIDGQLPHLMSENFQEGPAIRFIENPDSN